MLYRSSVCGRAGGTRVGGGHGVARFLPYVLQVAAGGRLALVLIVYDIAHIGRTRDRLRRTSRKARPRFADDASPRRLEVHRIIWGARDL